MAGVFPQLKLWPQSGNMSPYEWAEDTERASSTGSMSFGPDGASATMRIYVYWEDLADVLIALVGYSFRQPSATGLRLGAIQPRTITAATNANPVVYTSANHGLINNDQVFVWDIVGNGAANGFKQPITRIDDNTFSAVPTFATGNYVSGGLWVPAGTTLGRKLPWQHPIWNQMFVKRVTQVDGIQQQGTSNFSAFTINDLPQNPGSGGGGGDTPNLGPYNTFFLARITIEFWRPPYAVLSDKPAHVNNQEWIRYTDRQYEYNAEMLTRQSTAFEYKDLVVDGKRKQVVGGIGQKVAHSKLTRKWYNIPEQALFTISDGGYPTGLPVYTVYTQTPTTNPITGYVQASGEPLGGCVNNDVFLQTPQGTLLLTGVEIVTSPLQLPPGLMQIPSLGNQLGPLAQTQYDVIFHWDQFDPPRGPNIAPRGHNLVPNPGDGLWYPAQTTINIGTTGFRGTPFQYADMSDLFTVL